MGRAKRRPLDRIHEKGSLMRPVPADFRDRANELTVIDLAAHYGIGRKTIMAWGATIGGIPRKPARRNKPNRVRTPMPEDFAQHANEQNPVLMERYGCSHTLIARWRKECGISNFGTKPTMQVPEDFAKVAPGRSLDDLVKHYGRSKHVIVRWRAETGVEIGRRTYKPVQWRGPKSAPTSGPDISLLGRAADHLRRIGWVVTRRNAAGVFDHKGDHYLVGTKPLMTADEMVAFAADKGFVAHPERMAA